MSYHWAAAPSKGDILLKKDYGLNQWMREGTTGVMAQLSVTVGALAVVTMSVTM